MNRLLILSLLALFGAACTPKHTLFEGGRSEYSIVIEEDASPIVQYAARELRTWIREVSGAELPVGTGSGSGKRLVLETADPESRDDAFVYSSDGEDIRFIGNGPRGTLYAVYAFLENELGCRWYSSKVSVAPHAVTGQQELYDRVETASCFIKLEKGFHALELRYFEDCEGQVLDASLTGPDGTVIPMSEWRLYQ